MVTIFQTLILTDHHMELNKNLDLDLLILQGKEMDPTALVYEAIAIVLICNCYIKTKT